MAQWKYNALLRNIIEVGCSRKALGRKGKMQETNQTIAAAKREVQLPQWKGIPISIFRKWKHSRGKQPRRECHPSLCGGPKELALLHVTQGSKSQCDPLFCGGYSLRQRPKRWGLFHSGLVYTRYGVVPAPLILFHPWILCEFRGFFCTINLCLLMQFAPL